MDITFAGSENYAIVRTDESTNTYDPEDDIYFVERDGKTVPLNTASVKTFLNTITSLDLLTYASYNVTEEELAAFGLDEPMLSSLDETPMTQTVLHTQTDIPVFTLTEGTWTQVDRAAIGSGDVLLFAADSEGNLVWSVLLQKAAQQPGNPGGSTASGGSTHPVILPSPEQVLIPAHRQLQG